MSKHAAFLRGVNLGSRRRVSAVQLRSLFEEIGFGDVATFRTSGNVVFEAPRAPRGELCKRIESAFAESLGWESKVFLRTAGEMRAIAAREPFDRELVAVSKGKPQVSLLDAKPSAKTWAQVLALATEEDLLAGGARELYWLPSGGTRDSRLETKAIEELLGPATMRTKGTIELLTAKHLSV
ncbi:MAG TPA: DUF1697 domain-containing protein [Solirubrobacterales bacterium]|nr:DUF1697 domain-containing protein [Solirubrobacterales bacterium]